MNLSASTRTVLMFLNRHHDDRGSIYGNIAQHSVMTRSDVEAACPSLYENGLTEFRNDRVGISCVRIDIMSSNTQQSGERFILLNIHIVCISSYEDIMLSQYNKRTL